jgi:hypothetical protein
LLERMTALQSKISKPATRPDSDHDLDAALCDLRFRTLLPDDDWKRLPPATRQRFSKRLADGRTAVYLGEVIEISFSRAGWWLAQIARLIGGPLPISTDTHVPSIVTVTEDAATSGQIWTRIYARRNGFPQVIHSSKRFAGPTGLEEYLGFGIGMGKRWMSWIERDDLVRLIAHALAKPELSGPINATAPIPVTNRKFTEELGRRLRRPAVFRIPAGLLHHVAGDFADELLLGGQRVIPNKALSSGFVFRHETLRSAFEAIL